MDAFLGNCKKYFVFFCISVIFLPFLAIAEDQASIKIGQSVATEGANKNVGLALVEGARIYIDKINAEGGIQGKKIELISLNDDYDPIKAAKNVAELIDTQHVLAFLGNQGSASAVVSLPIINAKHVLLFGAYAGTTALFTNPPNRYVINSRASFTSEADANVKCISLAGIKSDEIAFFVENDAMGDSLHLTAVNALKKAGYTDANEYPQGRFARNTLNVEGALSTIMEKMKKPPRAIFLEGNLESNTLFIQLVHKQFPHCFFLGKLVNLSKLTQDEQAKVISPEVSPNPYSNLPAAIEYREDLKKYAHNAEPSPPSFTSFLGTKLFVLGLQKAATMNALTREGLIDAFETLRDVDIGIGEKISITKENHDALSTIWLMQSKNGKWTSLEWSDVKEKMAE